MKIKKHSNTSKIWNLMKKKIKFYIFFLTTVLNRCLETTIRGVRSFLVLISFWRQYHRSVKGPKVLKLLFRVRLQHRKLKYKYFVFSIQEIGQHKKLLFKIKVWINTHCFFSSLLPRIWWIILLLFTHSDMIYPR